MARGTYQRKYAWRGSEKPSLHAMWPPHGVPREEAERTPDTEFGARVRALRKAKGYTQLLLGGRMDMTQQAVGQLERSGHSPSLATLRKLSMALNVPVTELIGPIPGETAANLWAAFDAALGEVELAVRKARGIAKELAMRSAPAGGQEAVS